MSHPVRSETLAPGGVPSRAPHGVAFSSIPRRSDSGDPPLSFGQQRLWFLQRLEPASPAYNMPFAFRIRGPLDSEALRLALETISARHESLRTTFVERADGPVQVIHPPGGFGLQVTDLRSRPQGDRDTAARRIAMERVSQPFDLAGELPFRAHLYRLDDREHVLLLILHHIVSDAWSLGVLLRELSALYRGLVTGVPARLPELPIQYADFSVWQRGRMRGEARQRELAEWTRRLDGAPPLLELPTDRPRPDRAGHFGRETIVTLPPGLGSALGGLGRQEGATLFMTLLAGFQLLLSRWSGQQDIVVGAPIAGRNHLEVEELVGLFVNTLVLRTSLAGNPSFRELLGRVREVALQAYGSHELPFERLVQELGPERSLDHNPVFQVLFQLENTGRGTLELHGLEVGDFALQGAAKFDLTVQLRETAGGLTCCCRYREGLFSDESISHLLDQYRLLLEQIVAAPDAPIGSYSLLTPRSRLLIPDPTEPLAAPAYPLVTEVVARLGHEAAERVAVRQGNSRWTYAELAAAVRVLAHSLRERGVGPGTVVALTGRPGFGLVAGMLATLVCGGVMLPVAASLPDRRKRLMLREGGATYLLVDDEESRSTWVRRLGGVAVVPLAPGAGPAVGAEGEPPLAAPAGPGCNDAAYIFFTSGTSGTPKAVLGTHQGIGHFLNWQRASFGIGADDRCAQLTSLSFDVILRDVFLPLTSGAALCLPPEQLPPDAVLAWLAEEEITVLHVVPSLAQAWLDQAGTPPRLPALRWIFLSGEPLTDSLVRRWRQVVAPSCGLVNLYGPTETTMVKCCYRVPGEPLPGLQPAGGSLPQSQALVLSEDNRLCGVNEPGEIVLRTPFMTRGYLNAPEEQRRCFVPNPFGSDPADLVYRTGDRGRYRHDGGLMVLGRLDHQIKIRGVRIEPAEVTAVLSRHPRVRAGAVTGRPLGAEPIALVAYFVPGPGGVQPTELRAYLAARLPAAMVPSAFVELERLPLTANGKLDLDALPPPEPPGRPDEEDDGAPLSPLERAVADIWAEVLQLERVRQRDNFFDLGGHSLLATRVVARFRTAFGIELPLRTLFEAPTVTELARRVARYLPSPRTEEQPVGPRP